MKSKNPKHDQNIDESNLNNRLKLICENLSDLDIDYSVSRLLQLSTKEKKILKGLIKKYHEILMHKNKYINVEQLDNELKSDLDDEYDDEEEEEEEEEQQEEQEDESDHSSSSKKK